jgi:hypothetical protein
LSIISCVIFGALILDFQKLPEFVKGVVAQSLYITLAVPVSPCSPTAPSSGLLQEIEKIAIAKIVIVVLIFFIIFIFN